jgi:hypothetical protein
MEELCSDCPPVGYPTDKTRCRDCPRRTPDDEAEGKCRAAAIAAPHSGYYSLANLVSSASETKMARAHKSTYRDGKTVDELVDELFRLVEPHQGYFHVSDGETFPTTEQLFGRLRGRLEHGRAAVKKMNAFLRKYGEQ